MSCGIKLLSYFWLRLDHLCCSLLNTVVVNVDWFEYKFVYLFLCVILILYLIFLFMVCMYYYHAAMNNYDHVSLSKKTILFYSIIIILLVVLTFLSYYFDINMYVELKQDYQITKYHCVVKYAMISWFIILVMIAIYLYIYNTIDMYIWFAIFVYILLTFFIIYLLLCELYIINPLITAEIDRQNYLAKKIAEADAAKAILEQEALDRMALNMALKVIIYSGIAVWCMCVYTAHAFYFIDIAILPM